MEAASKEKVNSVALFKDSWALIKFTGIGAVGVKRELLLVYRALFYLVVCVIFPLNVTLGFLTLEKKSDFVLYMAVTTTTILAVVKHFCLLHNLSKIRRIEQVFAELDESVQRIEERDYFQQQIRKRVIYLLRTYVIVYASVYILGIGSWLLQRKRALLLISWCPFDWQNSDLNFFLIGAYQSFSLSLLFLINMHNDSYVPLTLSILVGHVRLLAMRVRRMVDADDPNGTNATVALRACIETHNQLLSLFHLLRNTVSTLLFAQIVSSGFIIAMSVLYVVFFAETFFLRMFYFFYAISMFFQNFPSCYYGSVLENEFDGITYAIFSCDWTNQQRVYRRSLLIFMLQTMQPIQLIAGKMIPININTYIKILRLAYSFFALGVQL